MARLKDKFSKEGISKLKAELKLKNDLEVPRLEKITLNMCLSEGGVLGFAANHFALGQKRHDYLPKRF